VSVRTCELEREREGREERRLFVVCLPL